MAKGSADRLACWDMFSMFWCDILKKIHQVIVGNVDIRERI